MMHPRFRAIAVHAVMLTVCAVPLVAQVDKTPNLGTTVPSGWSTDRYAPCQFNLANGVQGRDNVLQIGVCPQDAQANRPSAFSASFYNYQGEKIAIDPVGTSSPSSQTLALDLFVDPSWATSDNGEVATSFWTRLNQVGSDDESTAWYPILGFSNLSGVGMWRYWNSTLGWQDLAAPVNYGTWNTLGFNFSGPNILAYINNDAVATETADPGTTRVTDAFVQSYNSGQAYTANWSNASVTATPEPATFVLMGTGLAGLGGVGVARRRKSAQSDSVAEPA